MVKRREFIMRMPADLVEFIDGEGKKRERSRAFLIEAACRSWEKRLLAQRARAARGKR